MSDTTKGVWHRKEAEPGNYAKGWDALWGGRETILPLYRNEDGSLAVREMPAPEGEEGRDQAGSQEAA